MLINLFSLLSYTPGPSSQEWYHSQRAVPFPHQSLVKKMYLRFPQANLVEAFYQVRVTAHK